MFKAWSWWAEAGRIPILALLPLSMPKSLILSAKGSGFGSYTLEIAKERVRQGFGLGGQAVQAPMERGREAKDLTDRYRLVIMGVFIRPLDRPRRMLSTQKPIRKWAPMLKLARPSPAMIPLRAVGGIRRTAEALEVAGPASSGRDRGPAATCGNGLRSSFRSSAWMRRVAGEGNTPLVEAGPRLAAFSGLERLWLKNETQNPTGSFKDRGSLTCVFMARERGEPTLATVSTGNMGHSIAAYAARAGLRALVFVPEFAPREKLLPMTLHGATVIKVRAPDYALMKQTVLGLAGEFNLRIVSGNGPIRVEGYKLTAFELYEQTRGELPDYIAVPTSACGHLRGLFKGFRELQAAGLIRRCPRMIVVQAANNSPIVSALKQGAEHVIPFANFHTVAEAITSGNQM